MLTRRVENGRLIIAETNDAGTSRDLSVHTLGGYDYTVTDGLFNLAGEMGAYRGELHINGEVVPACWDINGIFFYPEKPGNSLFNLMIQDKAEIKVPAKKVTKK